MTGNPNFTGAAAQVTVAQAAVAAYAAAVAQAKGKVPGAVKVRGDARIAMMKALAPLVAIVQAAVDAHLEQAATLATSAAMKLRKAPTRNKAAFAVKDGPGTGQVHLAAKAVARGVALSVGGQLGPEELVRRLRHQRGQRHPRRPDRGPDLLLPLPRPHPQDHDRLLAGPQPRGPLTRWIMEPLSASLQLGRSHAGASSSGLIAANLASSAAQTGGGA